MQTTATRHPAVRLSADHHHYVIAAGDGFTCLGFNNARDHANQIADLLGRPDLAFTPEDYATLAGYAKYEAAVAAWGASHHTQHTYFDPGTAPAVRRVLEACRRSGQQVRLILGDPQTGQSWLDECDVVGRIARSTGWLKVPLLVEPGEHGGGAILTACVLGIIDWRSGTALYRHPAFVPPDLRILPADEVGFAWRVVHQGADIARFDDVGKAGAYVAFLRGATIEPRVFH